MGTIVLPTPTRFDVLETPQHRLTSVSGHAFAVLNNGWACMDELSRQLDQELRSFGAVDVVHVRTPHSQPSEDQLLDDVAAKVAGAITGLGN